MGGTSFELSTHITGCPFIRQKNGLPVANFDYSDVFGNADGMADGIKSNICTGEMNFAR